VLGPGINFIVPFLDRVAHKVSILERQLPNASQDAITKDNVLVQVDTSVFYRILEPEKTVYRIRDVDGAIATTVAGIVRAEIGKMELDEVQSNRSKLIQTIKASVEDAVDAWGIEVTRAEILDVNLDQATRDAMLQQLNAERERRGAGDAGRGHQARGRTEGRCRALRRRAGGQGAPDRGRCRGLCHQRRGRGDRQ
jgi:regulator of protease activity HflC (stomatin/prohibitin superfamily)